jgi:hypothetical protein
MKSTLNQFGIVFKVFESNFLKAILCLLFLQFMGKVLPLKIEQLSILYSHSPDVLVAGSSAVQHLICELDFPRQRFSDLDTFAHPLSHPHF